MYIKEINIKTFGGIENKTYNFSDGLNVLFGANESGKSTVIAFIKYIFYGFSGRKSEFKRYVPLSGEPMCGSITVCGDNCEYEIFRTSKGAKAKQISVVNKVNGDVMSADFAQNIGKKAACLRHAFQVAVIARIDPRLTFVIRDGKQVHRKIQLVRRGFPA